MAPPLMAWAAGTAIRAAATGMVAPAGMVVRAVGGMASITTPEPVVVGFGAGVGFGFANKELCRNAVGFAASLSPSINPAKKGASHLYSLG